MTEDEYYEYMIEAAAEDARQRLEEVKRFAAEQLLFHFEDESKVCTELIDAIGREDLIEFIADRFDDNSIDVQEAAYEMGVRL